MIKNSLAILLTLLSLSAQNISAEALSEPSPSSMVSIAELIIKLAPDLARELAPPSIGAERIVNNVSVYEANGHRTYLIDAKDIYFNTGRVLKNFRLRLVQQIASRESVAYTLDTQGKNIAEALLNTVFQISELALTHAQVKLATVANLSQEGDELFRVYEILGVNEVCEHTELNTFKLVLLRDFDARNQPVWNVVMEKPPVQVVPAPELPLPELPFPG